MPLYIYLIYFRRTENTTLFLYIINTVESVVKLSL